MAAVYYHNMKSLTCGATLAAFSKWCALFKIVFKRQLAAWNIHATQNIVRNNEPVTSKNSTFIHLTHPYKSTGHLSLPGCTKICGPT